MSSTITCPSCNKVDMETFYSVDSVPTNSCILLESPDEAVNYPRGAVTLGFCPHCGFISNMAFDQKLTEYSVRYEETQGFSGTFNKFHKALAERMIEQYDIRNKDVLEIGCGKGEFITMLCELGDNRGVGFDPGYRDDRDVGEGADKVTFIKDFYSEKYSEHKADFICCKMTLEHIHQTADFMKTVRRAIGDNNDTLVFFQIPEVIRILKECAFEDVYYEHCSYFSPGSLARLFRSCGFSVLDLATEYDDQYLTILAKPAEGEGEGVLPQEENVAELQALVQDYKTRCALKVKEWLDKIQDYHRSGRKVVLWGSGSKGVSFITTLGITDEIEFVVDINPYRQGYFMSGTGQKIVSPEFLKEYQPDVVVVMNAIYCDEISRDLDGMGLSPEVLAI